MMQFRRTLRFLNLLIVVIVPGAAFAQKLGQGGGDEVSAWRVVGALLLCLLLALAGAWALKMRMSGGSALPRPLITRLGAQGRRLQLVESLRLGAQVDLCIVSCDGRELLVAASSHGAQLLKPLGDSDIAAPEE
jgi:flagellar biogenesis protein FliO